VNDRGEGKLGVRSRVRFVVTSVVTNRMSAH